MASNGNNRHARTHEGRHVEKGFSTAQPAGRVCARAHPCPSSPRWRQSLPRAWPQAPLSPCTALTPLAPGTWVGAGRRERHAEGSDAVPALASRGAFRQPANAEPGLGPDSAVECFVTHRARAKPSNFDRLLKIPKKNAVQPERLHSIEWIFQTVVLQSGAPGSPRSRGRQHRVIPAKAGIQASRLRIQVGTLRVAHPMTPFHTAAGAGLTLP